MDAENKKVILDWIAANHAAFDELALEIWRKPEIAFQEREAVRLQMDFMNKQGFSVTQKEGLPLAFMAEWGGGGPVMGLLGEYDALDGLSQTVSARLDPVVPGAPGHGCGHNLLGVGCMLAACAVKAALSAAGMPGTIRYYGCPAEEQLTGKSVMAKLGYFSGTDLSIAWHPADITYVTGSTMNAMFSAKFRFKGRASHAGVAPEAGRSALDAVELMNIGSNYLREHMPDNDRLHYVITDGGRAPNVVPADAEVWYYARAPHAAELLSLWNRLLNVARGAAMMTETEVSHKVLGGCYNTLPNRALNKILEDNLLSFARASRFDRAELEFARALQASVGSGQVACALARTPFLDGDDRIMAGTAVSTFDNGDVMMGSTDVGDVANMMPASIVWCAAWPVGVPHHSWQAVSGAGSSLGLKGARQAAEAMAGALFDLAAGPDLVDEAKKEFDSRPNARPYSPIEELLK